MVPPTAGMPEPRRDLESTGAVGLCRLNRPEARNALSPGLREELADAVEGFDADEAIHCIVIAGNDEAFAAGADVKALAERSINDELSPTEAFWRRMASVRTPMIAAVSGWALGGGCELAMLCDMIVASETAEFGQPEITLAIIPGGGGTQRLARIVGKAAGDGAGPDRPPLQRRGGARDGPRQPGDRQEASWLDAGDGARRR